MLYDKICPICTKKFQHKKSHTIYCSDECVKKNHKVLQSKKWHSDPEFRKKKTEYERKRRLIPGKERRRSLEEIERHRKYQKNKYRNQQGIKSDEDLKNAPKGSGTINKHGYRQITVKNHPNSWRRGVMFEHIYVMSNHLGRPLEKHERVHHRNGIRDDNRIENLELWSHSQPYGQRVEDKLKWCKEFLEQYGHQVIMKESLNNQSSENS